MARTHTAQVSTRGGRWRLYVALMGQRVSQWPEYTFPSKTSVPTPAQRSQALEVLGYALVEGAEWVWSETSNDLENPSAAVRLFASAEVKEVA